ncbi:HD-GYP domain-containing protein [Frateuria hangzhouensis]|uniref:HD-GYP domain-containing protein n=1 Tax=Frateuria hangzhouensis TaxID=2995589 RepID=UPI00226103C1|nr:HD domain-containing phosphohydrolase [Frateuria sp. STR12]MCX7513626.1 phosphohydrolase [Frateuria sp. STR12]
MPRRPIDPAELTVGQPLRFNAYDARGKLLMRLGQVIGNEVQLEKLLEHGLFYGSEEECRGPFLPPTPSPLALVLDARERLQALLGDRLPADFPDSVAGIVELVREACRRNPDVALASILLRSDGPYGARHAVNAAIACQLTGTAMALDPGELAATVSAALTMNIGMFELHDQLVALEGPLSNEQQAAVRAHCRLGVARLRDHGIASAAWLNAVRDHHERADGSGYPGGKRGTEIGRPARLLALADVYCARVSGRDYRPPLQPTLALRWLFLNEGAALDEQLARMFIKTLGIYPPGTGVRLRNGSIAVVTQRGPASHQPVVASLTTHDGLRVGAPIRRRGDVEAHAVSEVVNLAALDIEVDMEALWGDDAVA